jgi:hypothetical protein
MMYRTVEESPVTSLCIVYTISTASKSINSRKANSGSPRHEKMFFQNISMEGSLPGNQEGDPERRALRYVVRSNLLYLQKSSWTSTPSIPSGLVDIMDMI